MPKKRSGGTLSEESIFEPDPKTLSTPKEKNDQLADLLKKRWNRRAILSIKRIEVGTQGWEAVIRK